MTWKFWLAIYWVTVGLWFYLKTLQDSDTFKWEGGGILFAFVFDLALGGILFPIGLVIRAFR